MLFPPRSGSQWDLGPIAVRADRPAGKMERVFLRFMLGSLAALVVVVGGGFLALRQIAIDEAEHDTRERVEAAGRVVEAAGLSDGVLTGDRAALRRLDDLVLSQVLTGSVVRVKLWSEDGSVLYSDVPRLIGRRFALGEEERELFREGGAEAELSDLSQPENRYERAEGKLLEAHTAIRTPNGTQVLFEIYQRFSSVSTDASRLLRAFAPALLGGLLVLLLFQLPLAWSLQRRLQRDHREREALLSSAIEASERERGQIAADLHDGVVQGLAGISYTLSAVADRASANKDTATADVVCQAARDLRSWVRDLRTLVVTIAPPKLQQEGLAAALHDLQGTLTTRGIAVSTDIAELPKLDPEVETLAFRVAQEAVRNVVKHADARTVAVRAGLAGDRLLVEVTDDGRGVAPTGSGQGGHGLALLTDLTHSHGGSLDVASAHDGSGTIVRLDLPAQRASAT